MVLRVGYYFGHLTNFDPARWHILTEGPVKFKGLEQLAYYRID